MNNLTTTLFHFHDGVISKNHRDPETGDYIPESGAMHLEVVNVDGIPTYARLLPELSQQETHAVTIPDVLP